VHTGASSTRDEFLLSFRKLAEAVRHMPIGNNGERRHFPKVGFRVEVIEITAIGGPRERAPNDGETTMEFDRLQKFADAKRVPRCWNASPIEDRRFELEIFLPVDLIPLRKTHGNLDFSHENLLCSAVNDSLPLVESQNRSA